jgi:hypothetical protein
VITWDNDFRARQGIQELARLPELPRAGALRQVAGYDNHGRLDLSDGAEEGPFERIIEPPEVDVREVQKGAHQGTKTFKARGSER